MYANEREELILNFVNQHDHVSTKQLVELTQSSIATVRRDLTSLAERGLIIKKYGCANKINDSEKVNSINRYRYRDPHLQKKINVAEIAVSLIKPHDRIFLGSGRTCIELASKMKELEDISIVTTNVNSVIELSGSKHINTILVGGDVHFGSNYIETLGESSVSFLNDLYFDKIFLTVDGCDITNGYSIYNKEQIPLYRKLFKSCKRFYLLLDSSKFNKCAFTKVWNIDELPYIITDKPVSREYERYFDKYNINVFDKI